MKIHFREKMAWRITLLLVCYFQLSFIYLSVKFVYKIKINVVSFIIINVSVKLILVREVKENILFCLFEKVFRPFQKLSAPRREHPLIGVVFNQQKSYIRNLHLYDDAPAQGILNSILPAFIEPPYSLLWVLSFYKRFYYKFDSLKIKVLS